MIKTDLVTAFKAIREKESYIPFHSHNYYELVYYINGQGCTQVGDESWKFSNGSFAVIPPGVEHDEGHDTECELFCIGFITEGSIEALFLNDTKHRVEAIASDIMEESLLQKSGYKDMIEARLMELAVVIKRMTGDHIAKNQARSFEYVINYLAENSHEKIVLKDLAKQMNFSYDYFQHQFKKLVGMSPQQFLIRKRIEMAHILLQEGQLNCTEIAYRCGFSNSAQFSGIYKREKGMNPTDVRKEKQEKQTSSLDTKRQKS